MDLHNNYADLYLRVSIDLTGKSTIDLQEADCRAWADKNGLTVRAVHVDRGRSGYKTGVERRGFEEALTAVTSGIVATLLVWKLDRLSRQGIGQIGPVLRRFEEAGGRLVAVQDDLDTARPGDRQLITKLSELARSESENLGLRVRSAKIFLRSKGRWIGGAAPYGLISKDGQLWPDPGTAPVVREIARQILSGRSLIEVARWLNAEDIPAARGGRWGVGSVAQLMRGPATAGLLPETMKRNGRYTGTVVPWRDPETGEAVSVMGPGERPLISVADQLRIIALFEERATNSRYGTRRGRTCSAPGGAYQRALDQAVVRQWMDHLTEAPEESLLAAVAERWAAVQEPEAMANRRAILGAISDGESALATLAEDHYVRRLMDRDSYLRLADVLTDRIDGLKVTLDSTPPPAVDLSALIDATTLQETWRAASTRERRELLRLALVEVRVTQGVQGRRFDPSSRLEFRWVDGGSSSPLPGTKP